MFFTYTIKKKKTESHELLSNKTQSSLTRMDFNIRLNGSISTRTKHNHETIYICIYFTVIFVMAFDNDRIYII